jgi:hypothetical protein
MTTYDDLLEYQFLGREAGTRNVGWLGPDREFEQAKPIAEVLDKVWHFCRMPVAQARGFHRCEFCSDAVANVERMLHADRNGERIYMGSAEIRVFARDGTAYAAPTRIYHYMKFHNYRPPDEFIRALTEGPAPWSVEYLDRPKGLGL